ncbi:SIR2 family NAD-dependent protein deacylase [Lunatimonas salinarum]|uniref:SIR2 family NAD-dependent protein deacylase n=1 Tax=Lunatimonas salinarum TaxID=1774590 RepID=UPI001ADFC25A|nr:NAD-dependent deacylase [Lunatimonas salinarum]
MQKLVVLTGAGISAESGIATFRDANGLWEGHNVMEVASPEGWRKNKELVLDFYNQRRKACLTAKPNAAHRILAELEADFDVTIITQNVDNLHEKAGSTKIIHLHGELFKSQSTLDPRLVYPIEGWELKVGDKCEMGSQLRPFIVWFGEQVPMMDAALEATQQADIFAIVGTSLLVYPAASLIDYASPKIPKYLIDPMIARISSLPNLIKLEEAASTGVARMASMLKDLN